MAGAEPRVALSPQVQRLAALPVLIVIATKRADGRVQLNPVWFEFADRYIWVNSNTRRSWPKHLQRDREAALLLTDPAEPDRYAQIRGRLVEVIPDPKHDSSIDWHAATPESCSASSSRVKSGSPSRSNR